MLKFKSLRALDLLVIYLTSSDISAIENKLKTYYCLFDIYVDAMLYIS